MIIFRGFRYLLRPTAEQEAVFRQFSGVCRLVYNLALRQRATWGRNHSINLAQQSRELTKLRAEFDWVRAVNQASQKYALINLDNAFKAFFSGKASYPRPKKRGADDSFQFIGRDVQLRKLNDKWSEIWLPKIGWVRYRDTRPTMGSIKNATVKLDALGWHVSLTCEFDHEVGATQAGSVGIDRGVATALVLSTGEFLTIPATIIELEKQKRKAQRVVSRRKKGSNRRRRAHKRVARIQAKQARIRRNFHHKATLEIANRFGVAVLERLNTRSMTASAKGTAAKHGVNVRQKAGLNRAILNAGWHQFETILIYKMEERGGQVVTVPAEFTSQTCAACGVIDARSRKSQARFECVSCGHIAHADINAAINIERRWSTPLLDVEGLHKRPCEASTLKSLCFDKSAPDKHRGC